MNRKTIPSYLLEMKQSTVAYMYLNKVSKEYLCCIDVALRDAFVHKVVYGVWPNELEKGEI